MARRTVEPCNVVQAKGVDARRKAGEVVLVLLDRSPNVSVAHFKRTRSSGGSSSVALEFLAVGRPSLGSSSSFEPAGPSRWFSSRSRLGLAQQPWSSSSARSSAGRSRGPDRQQTLDRKRRRQRADHPTRAAANRATAQSQTILRHVHQPAVASWLWCRWSHAARQVRSRMHPHTACCARCCCG